MARHLGGEGFEDLEADDVEELLVSHGQELSEEDVEELIKSSEEEEEEDNEAEIFKPALTITNLNKIMAAVKSVSDLVCELDPFMERSLKFKRNVEDAELPYKELLKDLIRNRSKVQFSAI